MSATKREKERIRKQKWREGLKKKPEVYGKYLESEKMRKRHAKLTSSVPNLPTTPQLVEAIQSPTTPNTAFSTKQSRNRSLKKADDHLPQSPRKKVEIIQNLASKYQIRIKLHESRGRPRKELSEKKKEWMFEFLGRSDITHTNPGRQDNVYVGKVNGERQYLPRQYLLWTLRDLLDIVNGTSELLSIQNSSSYSFLCSQKSSLSRKFMILLRAINSLFLTKIFLTHLVFVTSVKMW